MCVALTGNLTVLSLDDLNALSDSERAAKCRSATDKLKLAGAHYVVDGVADLLPVLAEIEGRLVRGERP